MPCYYPLQGYKSRRSDDGKRKVTFKRTEGFSDLPVPIPCGQCIGCRLERSRQWAVRIMHEASMHEENSFVTLTYDEEHEPPWGSLDPRAFQLFMKRLRKRVGRVRFFQCGEYGAQRGRPHHHACLFGVGFWDKTAWSVRGGFPVYRSAFLEELWPYGFSEIGSLTFESAAYVARYITKKVTGNEVAKAAAYEVVDVATGEVGRRYPEYATMSRRPGIGRRWLDEYGNEVLLNGTVVMRGREMKAPRYYDEQFDQSDPDAMEEVRKLRRSYRRRRDETAERLEVRATVARAGLSLKGREL